MNKENSNAIIIQYITGKKDLINRRDGLSDHDISKAVGPILETASYYNVPVHLLTNSSTNPSLPGLITKQMDLFDYDDLSVYLQRIELTFYYLLQHPELEKIAVVDSNDVSMINYPFDQIKADKLYLGVENIYLRNAWIVNEQPHPDYMNNFFSENGQYLLLNPGIIVGYRSVILEYFGMMTKIISQAKVQQQCGRPGFELGSYEMALCNYVAYTYFSDRLVYGRQVSTKFTAREPQSSSWFRHK